MLDKIEKNQSIEICQKALDKWGFAIQKVVAMEECSELIEAMENARTSEFHNIEEETADVEIMCLQLRIIYGSSQIDDEKVAMNQQISTLDSDTIIACSNLIKSISKEIREKNSRIHESIARIEIICEQLRNTFNKDKIEEYKQSKLKRLRDLVL
jgi:hypothetical protein